MVETERTGPNAVEKLKLDDRFQPAKRNLIWVSILSVALAFADTATPGQVKDPNAIDTVKIPGLDLSFPIGLAAAFLLLAVVYCFAEYWLEYLTARIENSNASRQIKDISLTSLFQRQEHTIHQAITRIETASIATAAIPAKVGEAMDNWQRSLIPDTTALAQAIQTFTNEIWADLNAAMLAEGLGANTQKMMTEIVYRRVISKLQNDYRNLLENQKFLPRNPAPVFSNTDVEQIKSDLQALKSEMREMDNTQRLLAKDFRILNANIFGAQKIRFKWIDFLIPCGMTAIAVVACTFVISVSVVKVLHTEGSHASRPRQVMVPPNERSRPKNLAPNPRDVISGSSPS